MPSISPQGESLGIRGRDVLILTVDSIQINTYKANLREYSPGEFRCYDDKHVQILLLMYENVTPNFFWVSCAINRRDFLRWHLCRLTFALL